MSIKWKRQLGARFTLLTTSPDGIHQAYVCHWPGMPYSFESIAQAVKYRAEKMPADQAARTKIVRTVTEIEV